MMTPATTRPRSQLTLKDRLSRLTFVDACKLLGPSGAKLIQKGGNRWDPKIHGDVFLGDDLFRLCLPEKSAGGQAITVSITLMAEARQRLHYSCSQCFHACEHVGAAFSLILEEKRALGLAEPPPPRVSLETLDEGELVAKALAERAERARIEKMAVRPADGERPWTDYTVTNKTTGKSYRVALRGLEPGISYCSCPDFRTNTLGTCKHILHVLRKVKRRFTPRQLRQPYRRKHLAVALRYGEEVTLHVLAPERMDEAVTGIVQPLLDRPVTDLHDLLKRLARLEKLGQEVTVYPDAEEYIQQQLLLERLRERTASIRSNPAGHSLRTTLLKLPLLPYQLDGIAFAAGAGRAVLADDMGLGKTIQGVGVAEFLAREADIKKVLIVCPASLKSQWRNEIQPACDRSVQLISGPAAERGNQYANDSFFTVCNYEQVLRDILAVESVPWDLIILDEGQRIKNWASKTSRVIKGLKSRFALVLSGTPLENRLDELYSVVQFVDDRRLGPGFRFFNKHRVTDEKGKVLGYKNLSELREALAPVLLRRTRDNVKLELPERTTEYVRIPPTDEQLALHQAHMQIVVTITRKKFISEMDLLRLQRSLLMCRMAANSTFLVNKEAPGHSTKLEHLDDLLGDLFEEQGRKVVLFSEWTTMLNLIEEKLHARGLAFVRLDGSVPQRERQELVHKFQTDPDCKLFITTNAGSTGLNLQAANTVINVDLPWNPAILEQRIARAHRMGQTQEVQVFVLVTEDTIEESLLTTIAAKRDLALAALDTESEVDQVSLVSGIEELKGRLEILLGAKPEAPVDESQKHDVQEKTQDLSQEHRTRVGAAGGELLGAAFRFFGELAGQQNASPPPAALVENLRAGLNACVDQDAEGKPRLSITLPDRGALEVIAQSLARLLNLANPRKEPLSLDKAC
jgi:superfamily II DNA or RNA helicase